MIKIVNKAECCGCTACASACPMHCITMRSDEEGFLYPEVEESQCIQCGLCEKTCPVLNKQTPHEEHTEFFVVRTHDKEILKASTSGGFVTPVCDYVFDQNGVVCGAVFDEEFNVVHQIFEPADRELALQKMRGSKYVQSRLDGVYQRIQNYLQENRLVCFVGTPCQVGGLYAFLGERPEHLLTIDLVCHGVPSPKLWDLYKEYQRKRYHSELRDIQFRHKTYGYRSSTMRIEFENGKCYYGSARVDYMLKSFFSEISSRPSCYQCAFKGVARTSDCTIYDCWRPQSVVAGLVDDNQGYTNVIVHTPKMKKILDSLSDEFEVYPIEANLARKNTGRMVIRSAISHPKRNEFYSDLESNGIKGQVIKYIPINNRDFAIEHFKRIVFKLGIYEQIRRIWKQ